MPWNRCSYSSLLRTAQFLYSAQRGVWVFTTIPRTYSVRIYIIHARNSRTWTCHSAQTTLVSCYCKIVFSHLHSNLSFSQRHCYTQIGYFVTQTVITHYDIPNDIVISIVVGLLDHRGYPQVISLRSYEQKRALLGFLARIILVTSCYYGDNTASRRSREFWGITARCTKFNASRIEWLSEFFSAYGESTVDDAFHARKRYS